MSVTQSFLYSVHAPDKLPFRAYVTYYVNIPTSKRLLSTSLFVQTFPTLSSQHYSLFSLCQTVCCLPLYCASKHFSTELVPHHLAALPRCSLCSVHNIFPFFTPHSSVPLSSLRPCVGASEGQGQRHQVEGCWSNYGQRMTGRWATKINGMAEVIRVKRLMEE